MKVPVLICSMVLMALAVGSAQVASHTPTGISATQNVPSDKPVARVNNVVLTERDLVREMYVIFPYARQHNGFPKGQEADIRKGALDMIVFEELVYQEAQRRKIPVTSEKVSSGLKAYKAQFSGADQYQAYLKEECQGSEKVLRERVRRSLMIDWMLHNEIETKSVVTSAEVRAYYSKNPKKFARQETFAIQTISILPRPKELPISTKKRAEDAARAASATKTFEDFGLLAEKVSDDDYRVNMGEHKSVSASEVPPAVLTKLRSMKAGQVSGSIQVDQAYTIIRLNAHNPAGPQPYAEVKAKLSKDLSASKKEQLRASLNKKLASTADVQFVR